MNAIYPSIDESVEASFEETFEQSLRDYWTLVLPPRPYPKLGCMNEWYAQDIALTRGCFMRERDAHIWAHENLRDGPYTVRFLELPCPDEHGNTLEEHHSVPYDAWPRDRDCLRYDTTRYEQGDECSFHRNGGMGSCNYCEDGGYERDWSNE